MNNLSKKIVFLGVILVIAVFGMSFNSITGFVVKDCQYYYNMWGHETWLTDWGWWQRNCNDFRINRTMCGNSILEAGEICDTTQLLDCKMLGFTGGILVCSNCQLNTSGCYDTSDVNYETIQECTNQLALYMSNNSETYENYLNCTENYSALSNNYQQCQASLGNCSESNNTNSTDECYDSDGGINYYISGSLSDEHCDNGICMTGDGIEGCENNTLLLEGYCDENETMKFMTYTCPNGCSNGACIENETSNDDPLPEMCEMSVGLTCMDFIARTNDTNVSDGDSEDNIQLIINNNVGSTIYNMTLSIQNCSNEGTIITNSTLVYGAFTNYTIPCASMRTGTRFSSNLYLNFTTINDNNYLIHTVEGYIVVEVDKI